MAALAAARGDWQRQSSAERARKLLSTAEIGVGVEHIGGHDGPPLVALRVNDSHFTQSAKVVLNLGLTRGHPRLVEGIDFTLIIQIYGFDVERSGIDGIRHATSIVLAVEAEEMGGAAGAFAIFWRLRDPMATALCSPATMLGSRETRLSNGVDWLLVDPEVQRLYEEVRQARHHFDSLRRKLESARTAARNTRVPADRAARLNIEKEFNTAVHEWSDAVKRFSDYVRSTRI